MTAQVIDGKQIASNILGNLKIPRGKRQPKLCAILVGNDPASKIYVAHKQRACDKAGIASELFELEDSIREDYLIELIKKLNNDVTVDGILVQLPLPKHLNTNNITDTISYKKDVDGFHPINVGLLAQKRPALRACTPFGIMQILSEINVKLKGLDAVVVGRSNIVGMPMVLELMTAGCTVTSCGSNTKDLAEKISAADLLIVAIGKPEFVKAAWIKKGAIVIDVGINRMDNGTLVGDVEFLAAKEKASWITPVPGGVGPLTVATLLKNTLEAYETNNT